MVLSRVLWHYHDEYRSGVPVRVITEECGIPAGEVLALVANQYRSGGKKRFWQTEGKGDWGEPLVVIGLGKWGPPDSFEC